MTIHSIDEELLGGDDADWLESQFFSQASMRYPDLDWGPVSPLPPDMRRAMHATLGMLVVAVLGLIAFIVYSQLIMPAPEPVGSAEPLLPPTAAGDSHVPNG
jgi:hypothetical protein